MALYRIIDADAPEKEPKLNLSKQALAKEFGIAPVTLWRWFKKNPDLVQELELAGYDKRQKVFTIKQYQIIRKYYG